jgi:hypothetical protein
LEIRIFLRSGVILETESDIGRVGVVLLVVLSLTRMRTCDMQEYEVSVILWRRDRSRTGTTFTIIDSDRWLDARQEAQCLLLSTMLVG